MDSVKSLVNKALKASSGPNTQQSAGPQLQVSEESLQASLATNQSLTNLLLGSGLPSPVALPQEENEIEITANDQEMQDLENKLTESKSKIN